MPSWRKLVVAFIAAQVILLMAALPAVGAPPVSSAEAHRWYREVVGDLAPLQSSLVNGLNAASGWQRGAVSASAAGRAISRDLPSLERARGAVGRLKPLPGYGSTKADYTDAIGLYVEAFALELTATGLRSGPLATQLQRSFERIRELGDITFDQGTAVLGPLLGPSIAGADTAQATHLPDWIALGLEPQAPLLSPPDEVGANPAGSANGASGSATVRNRGAPTQGALRAAVSVRATRQRLTGLVDALDEAEISLSSMTVAPAKTHASDLLRLGLLVDAEGLLAAEASALSPHGPAQNLVRTAASLLRIGTDLRVRSG
jgi:hypothetical protein